MRRIKTKQGDTQRVRGFSIMELTVAVGVSSILALGTGAALIQSWKTAQDAHSRADAFSLARQIKTELESNQVRRMQLVGGAGSQDCGGRFNLPNGWDSTAMQTASGVPIRITLASSGGNTVSADVTDNRVGGVKGNSRVLNLIYANGAPIADEAGRESMSGEIYLNAARDTDQLATTALSGSNRPIYVTRLLLKRDTTTGNIVECNVPARTGNLNNLCDATLGMVYDNVTGRCITKVNQKADGTPLQLCGIGLNGPSNGLADANCTPVSSGCSIDSDGNGVPDAGNTGLISRRFSGTFECEDQPPYYIPPPAAPTPPPSVPPALPPSVPDPSTPPTTGPGSDCEAIERGYQACMDASAKYGPFACTAPTPPCSDIVIEPQPIVLDPPLPPPPTNASCNCAGNIIAHGENCGYCTEYVDYGYGGYTDMWRIEQCNNGALVDVTGAQFDLSNTSCNGEYNQIYTGSCYSSYYCY